MNKTGRVQLSEIASLITKGTTPTTIGYEFQDSGINFLKIECFDEYGNYIKSKVAHISGECHEKLKRSQLKSGDILFSIAGAIGRVAIITDEMLPANTNQALAIIRITHEDVYLPYIKLILSSPLVKEQFEKKKQGVAQLNISLKDINELTIPLPDIDDQISLTALFEKPVGIIAKRQQQLSAFDDLIKARFVETFGDPDLAHIKAEWKTISEIGTVVGGATPKTNIDEYWDGEYRWITPAELDTASWYIYDSARKLTEAGVKSCSLAEIPVNTVILSSRAPIGKVAIAGKTFYCNQGFKNIICNKDVHPVFLYSLLVMNNDYLNSLGRGATFKEISKSIVENIKIPVPPYSEQEEFASFCMQINKSKSVIQKSLDETQLLFDSLMQQYFG